MTAERTATRMPAIGDVFAGDYEILGLAGVGGYAQVYRARARHLDAEVAVKVLDPQLGGSALDAFLQRFYREALLTSALTHPNTVTPIDYGRTPDGSAYIVMEYLEGESIADLLDRGDSLEPSRVRRLVIDVLESLHEAHSRGIVHADIKSSNIFLQRGNPHARVLDFGVASLIDDEASTSQVFGTPHYIAPEAAVGNPVAPASDIYSLGITAFEMLHNRFPFDGSSPRDILKAHVVSPMPEMREDLRNSALGHFIERATTKSPSIRPTAMECVEILRSSTSPMEPLVTAPLTPARGINVDGTLDREDGRTPSLKMRAIAESPADNFTTEVHARTDTARRLKAAVGRGLNGKPTVVLLGGPSGVGKERLIRGVLQDAELPLSEDQIFVMLGEVCITPAGRYDFAALLEQLPRRFDGLERLSEPASELAAQIRRRPGDEELLKRFVDFITAVARRHPFVWVITALERADAQLPSTISLLLDHLSKSPAPLTVVLAASDDEPVASRVTSYLVRNIRARTWEHCEELILERLGTREMYELTSALEPMADNVVELLVTMSEGNPGRLLWLLRTAKERKLLRVEHGRLVRRLRADFTRLSEDLSRRSELRERVLHVLEEERALSAAVSLSLLGPDFSQKLANDLLKQLTDMLVGEPDVMLRSLVDRNILARVEGDAGLRYRFHHHAALVSLQSSLPEQDLDVIVLSAALVLERDKGSFDSARRAAELFSRSGDHQIAARCALRGACIAAESAQAESEAELYRLAMSECQLGEMRFQASFLAEVELGLARCRMREGSIGAAEELLHSSLERSVGSHLDALELESHLLLAEIGVTRGDTEAISVRARRMLQLARELENHEGMVRALMLVGQYSRTAGRRKEAARSFVQAETLASEHDLPLLRARARMGIARLLAEEHQWKRAEQLMQEAIKYFRSSSRYDLLIEALVELGNVRLQAGETSDALFRDAEKLAEEHGHNRMLADILGGQAKALVRSGELNTASILLLRAVERYRALGSRRGEANTLLWLARASLQRRQIEAARTYIVEAIEVHRAARDAHGYIESLVLGAEIALLRRTPRDAVRWARTAAERLEGNRRKQKLLCRALLSEGRALSQLSQREHARVVLAQAQDLARECGFADLERAASQALED